MSDNIYDKLDCVAIIIDNNNQLKELKKEMKRNGLSFSYSTIDRNYPVYEMLYVTDYGVFSVPNGVQRGNAYGIQEKGFQLLTIYQLRKLLEEMRADYEKNT